MTAQQFREHQAALGWSNDKLRERMRVHISTVEKWRSGVAAVPGPAAALLETIVADELRARRG
jgi:DNA-binding transcriptional regulator YiaG